MIRAGLILAHFIMAKGINIKINSADKVEQMLQETYDESVRQINQIENEIGKLTTSTMLAEVTIDEKAKFFKAMNDLLTSKHKAIAMKLDIAKVMSEILKHNGDVDESLNGGKLKTNTFDINKLRSDIASMSSENDTVTYKLKG